MTQIQASQIRDAVCDLCIRACTVLPDDVRTALRKALDEEESKVARGVLAMLLENAKIAETECIPICQDTGLTHVFLEIGQEVTVCGGDLYQAVSQGVSLGYTQGYLRKSVVWDPLFRRVNTGDNTPPVVHVEIVSGDEIRITVVPKGTGSENMSALAMLTPAAGPRGVKHFVVETVRKAGSNPCPPLIVGVGVGGMMDHAAFMAKKAVIRPVGQPNPDPLLAQFERELLQEINSLGIGPAGLGGKTTALAVHVETYPTHIGALPVAVVLQCHAARRAYAVIRGSGTVEYLAGENPPNTREEAGGL